ncbi:unnamed protein product, partial [Brassica rapa subsp. trilocularis]
KTPFCPDFRPATHSSFSIVLKDRALITSLPPTGIRGGTNNRSSYLQHPHIQRTSGPTMTLLGFRRLPNRC